MTQVWGALLIFVVCPLLGGLPLTGWWVQLATGKRLAQIGTGNVGVSAAFYHGGTAVGLGGVFLEAFKGIGAVLLARHFFPTDPIWPVVALMALVMGRYWLSRGAGVTNVSWGFLAYDPLVAVLGWLLSLIAFTVLRERKQGRLFALVLLPVLTGMIHNDGARLVAVACLMSLIGWIYQKLPDDLELPTQGTRTESRRLFRFFRGESALQALDQVLDPAVVGNKAATLSQLKAWGYPVPMGYILRAGDDPAALLGLAEPSPQQPLVVRSSAVGEDGLGASAAGQYVSVTDVVDQEGLNGAIATCFQAYNRPSAAKYRQDQGLSEAAMNVLVQQQIQGVISGVAFSRDPIARCGHNVVIEALPGPASQVVSGQITPRRYHVAITSEDMNPGDDWQLSDAVDLPIESDGEDSGVSDESNESGELDVGAFHGTPLRDYPIPSRLIQQIAYLTRHLECRFGDIPQDVEWTYDGEQIWVLQSRPITTLVPLWTRKIAAEVIPGVIRPLTWSINQPLTCGVWGDLFTIVLGQRAVGLDFSQTAMLHRAHAYFNATLLGDIFLRMGLPAESLEFLTRGAKFSRPPIVSTLRNVPGLVKLAKREWHLTKRFARDNQEHFQPGLDSLRSPYTLSPEDIKQQIETILALLEKATFYNILGPLSFALRKAILKVDSAQLNYRTNPEIAAVEAIKDIARWQAFLLDQLETVPTDNEDLFEALAQLPESDQLFDQLDGFLATYGYLSEVATDISVPTWREQPAPVRTLLATFLRQSPAAVPNGPTNGSTNGSSNGSVGSTKTDWKQRQVQTRLDLKGQVAEVYNRLLAELRTCFLALERHYIGNSSLQQAGDIFFLTWPEIKTWGMSSALATRDVQTSPADGITTRRQQYQADQNWTPPYLVYGKDPLALSIAPRTPRQTGRLLTGIGASPGTLEGEVQVLTTLDTTVPINQNTILVVPYTDAGWAPLLANLGGLIAEVGGQLSHGAIVAREYGIPAVMDVADVTQRLRTGQRVRIDGQQGTVEIL
ncbi:glycerol-3-phosphate acyltransferase [Leptolyngbya cf. ectocarpi LEGE 11479]|uniref:Glycerol-3-phosphate acyltransferase n=1 Tax=Leptolyngbya cf. ectocarpi LEGE 11479 TaxID=1828722 RepID=A0A928ZQY4_LEPEC|nr:glycerol-3-phosphate acyltransferase [Leptolyngbya ectocarpi]MBE9066745.1 glycerol-3-phosphate acyltransferase [Leptolyngbya cf. ectocarpi LEGE 11479]